MCDKFANWLWNPFLIMSDWLNKIVLTSLHLKIIYIPKIEMPNDKEYDIYNEEIKLIIVYVLKTKIWMDKPNNKMAGWKKIKKL